MNLLDIFEGREPYQQAIDKLEQRRIEDLEAKMDDCARRGDKEGFQKCKAERDSYHKVKEGEVTKTTTGLKHRGTYGTEYSKSGVEFAKQKHHADLNKVDKTLTKNLEKGMDIKMDEGSMKQWLWNEAERMDRDAFVANAAEYGMSDEEAAEWWDSINGVDEASIGQDIVNKTEKMARATPQSRAGAVASTVKNAAKWLAGRGGPGQEGPTYEQEELDEKLKGLPTKKLGSARDAGKSIRKFRAQRGLEETGTDSQWSKESNWKQIPKAKSGRPVDPRGEVTHLSDVARREAERKANQKKNTKEVEEGFQDFNKVEPYAVCLAGRPVKKFDYYEQARRFHDNWKQKLYREGDIAKAEKITLMPLNLDEGDVVPFRRPVAQAAWQKLPGDVLQLANDWFWATQEDSGLQAVSDPTGYGQGTANEIKYVQAKLQSKGWTVDFDDEIDNIVLTNRQGQTVALPVSDAYDAKGWAADTLEEAGNPAQQAAIAIAMKRAGKKPKSVAEGATVAYIVDIESEYGDKGEEHISAMDPQDAIRKVKAKFKDGEYAVWPTGVRRAEAVDEAQTDYQKRRKRERDVDAGRPVKPVPKNPQTDYARKRAQDRKDMELGEMDKSQKSPAGWNLDDYDYSKGKWTQGKIMTAKDAVKSASKEFDSVFNKPNPKDKKKSVEEEKTRLDPKCWTGKKIGNPKTKMKGGVRVNNCVPAESVEEGWKSALGGAALAGAMALGGAGAAQAQSSGPNIVNPTTVIQQIQSGKIQTQNDLMSALGNASNKQGVWKQLQTTAGMQGSGDVNAVISAIGHKNTAGSQQQTVKSVNQPQSSNQSQSFVQRPTDNFEGKIKEDQDTSPVESAIIRRIMVAHVDWLQKFGPEKVIQAAEEVAYNVGDVDEIGTSDVSAYVHEVGRILGAV